MASIHRRPGSKYFHAAFRGPGGKLVLRSTKHTERSHAERTALEFERVAKLAMRGELVEAQARSVINDLLEKTCGDSVRAPAVSAFLREWIQGKEVSRAARTAERYRKPIEDLIAHLGQRAERPISSVTPRDVQTFLNFRRAEGCSTATVDLDATVIRSAFNHARRLGLVQTNPAENVDRPAKDSISRGTFTPTDVMLLVNAAEGEWRTVILLGYFTGARLSECCRVRWADVDLQRGQVVFQKTKQGKPHTVPLHPDLAAHLESLASADEPGFLTPKVANVKPSGRRGLSESFKRIARLAGVDVEMVEGTGRNKVSKRSFHALRHSFTSALANAGVSEEVRMKLTGHSSKAVHQKYTHHELEVLRANVSKLPSLPSAS
jgi:integrase